MWAGPDRPRWQRSRNAAWSEREAHVLAHPFMPLVGDRHEVGIGGSPQRLDQRRQRVAEILVLAPTEAVPSHDDLAAEALLLMVEARDGVRFGVGQELRHDSPTLGVEIGVDLRPVDGVHPRLDRR